jgi:hypothetical protein
MEKLWVGQIPDIFGYGLLVLEDSEDKCRKALRKAYNDWAKNYPDTYGRMEGKVLRSRFDKAMHHWGGEVRKIEIGKVYYDNFNY